MAIITIIKKTRVAHATDKARLLAAASLTEEIVSTCHPLPQWVSGCQTKLSESRLLID